MNVFSISQLSQFSGVKPHTIRIWETRYNALKPTRSQGNTRYYDDHQLRRLLNIVTLKDDNYRLSDLCSMSDEELFELINRKTPFVAEGPDWFINRLISAGTSYDEDQFNQVYNEAVAVFGMESFYKNIACPLLQRVGVLWAGNTLPGSQEHFISNLIRQKLYAAIDAEPSAAPGAEKWLLFLPEDEFHEIGLLAACYLLRASGRKVLYLGASVSADWASAVAREQSISRLLAFFVHRDHSSVIEEYANTLLARCPDCVIHFAGNTNLLRSLVPSEHIRVHDNIDSFLTMLGHD